MSNAQEYIELNFPKNVVVDKNLEGHLDLSEYPNLICVDIGINSRLTSLKLAHSNPITWMSLFEVQDLQSQKQQIINDQQTPINQLQQLSNITFPNSPYNFTKLEQEIIRLKVQELAPQVRNESTKLAQLITETKSKAGHFSLVVDLLLENQKQIVQSNETSQRDKFSAKMEAYQTILINNLAEEELQKLLNKQTEVLKLEEHIESLQQNLTRQ
ncbi:17630_t:CDS:2 [Funneliformis caledonium]|uniref:17630_t:CDS:1 n=1 Tax=Funneliformis caledonium TaxID=1117310 RepID=A0A9N8W3M9_9GLOM|nr:17630_t:CDS:2 [Funneliformis caledonium]